jgi:hypothetical protein
MPKSTTKSSPPGVEWTLFLGDFIKPANALRYIYENI